jgi:streptogrisin C
MPPPECSDPVVTLEGSLRHSGSHQVAPRKGFRTRGGTLHACLTGPPDADFDLYLQVLTSRGWRTVAVSDGDTAREELRFRSGEGTFRLAVFSVRGSGNFALAIESH